MDIFIGLIFIAAFGGFIFWKKLGIPRFCTIGTLTDEALLDTGGGQQVVGYQLNSNGHIYIKEELHEVTTRFIKKEKWIGSCPKARYECRLSVDSGDNVEGSPTDVWLLCSSTNKWELVREGVGRSENVCSFNLRVIGTTTMETVEVTMSVLRVI